MQTTVRNLTNSPFDLPNREGVPVRLPAFGLAVGDFSGEYIELLRASMAVEIMEPAPSAPVATPLDRLRSDAEALGVSIDRRWGEARLKTEIAKARKEASNG